jgi:hypothetical protein
MKLSQFLAPDRVTLDTAHGEHYHTHSHTENALDASYRTARDKLEQKIARRECTDPDFRAFMASMTWAQREDWLDEHCGKRPGRQKYKNEYNRNKSSEKRQHGGVREQVIPEGMITIDAAAALLECSYRSAYWYMKNGARRHGQHVRLRSEKHGKLNLTRPEWVAEFRREAFWLAIDKAARGIMAEQGESTT